MNWTAILTSIGPGVLPTLTVLVGILLNSRQSDALGKSINQRIDDLVKAFGTRFDGVESRLSRIEAKLDEHTTRIARLEAPIVKSTR